MTDTAAAKPAGTECRLRTTRADCVACGREHRLSARSGQCDCERRENLSVRYPLDPATRSELLRTVGENPPSLWRYAPILPVDARFGSRLKVGWTLEILPGQTYVPPEDDGESGELYTPVPDDLDPEDPVDSPAPSASP